MHKSLIKTNDGKLNFTKKERANYGHTRTQTILKHR